MKYAVEFLLAPVIALCFGLFVYGMYRYPDAPLHPCGVNQFCGKGNRTRHTEEQFKDFLRWERSLLISWPFGMAAGYVLQRRSRRRSFQAWERIRATQSELSPAIEEPRYSAAWKDLRTREWTGRLFFFGSILSFILGIGSAIYRAPVIEGEFFGVLAVVLFALNIVAGFWYTFFRCPRCNNRYFMVREHTKTCIHCGLRRGATFEQALSELEERADSE